MKHWRALIRDDQGSAYVEFSTDTLDLKVVAERLDQLLTHATVEKVDFVASHTRHCGTTYRGCAPECTFEADREAIYGQK